MKRSQVEFHNKPQGLIIHLRSALTEKDWHTLTEKHLISSAGDHNDWGREGHITILTIKPSVLVLFFLLTSHNCVFMLIPESSTHISQAGGEHVVRGRGRSHYHHGPSRIADPGWYTKSYGP